jgi:hypothetical protein
MNSKPKLFQIIQSIIIILICSLIALMYGWQGYSTLTERAGLRGDMHFYYRLTIGQFSTYNLLIASLAFVLILSQVIFFFNKNARGLRLTFWIFVLLIILIIFAELYLQTRFVPKG